MTPKRTLELLQNCIDHFLIGANVTEAIKFLIELIGFTKEELITLGFSEEDIKQEEE